MCGPLGSEETLDLPLPGVILTVRLVSAAPLSIQPHHKPTRGEQTATWMVHILPRDCPWTKRRSPDPIMASVPAPACASISTNSMIGHSIRQERASNWCQRINRVSTTDDFEA
jgi:hypothetical protein